MIFEIQVRYYSGEIKLVDYRTLKRLKFYLLDLINSPKAKDIWKISFDSQIYVNNEIVDKRMRFVRCVDHLPNNKGWCMQSLEDYMQALELYHDSEKKEPEPQIRCSYNMIDYIDNYLTKAIELEEFKI